MDHDQRFKKLLEEFFPEFLQMVLPDWASRFEVDKVEWLKQELFANPPQGERRYVDLLAKVPTTEPIRLAENEDPSNLWLTLIHIEVESQASVAPLRRRMAHYYHFLRFQFDLPVLPIAVYLHVGLDGLGWDKYSEHYWDEQVLLLRYPYLGLPALAAEEYLAKDNVLAKALTALMKMPKESRLEIGQKAWNSLIQCNENAYRKFLLCECVDAYLPEDEVQRSLFEEALLSQKDPGVQQMTTTLFEKIKQEGIQQGVQQGIQQGIQQGVQQGVQQGLQLGQRKVILHLFKIRFGELSAKIQERVESASEEEIQRWLVAFERGDSLAQMGLGDNQD